MKIRSKEHTQRRRRWINQLELGEIDIDFYNLLESVDFHPFNIFFEKKCSFCKKGFDCSYPKRNIQNYCNRVICLRKRKNMYQRRCNEKKKSNCNRT